MQPCCPMKCVECWWEDLQVKECDNLEFKPRGSRTQPAMKRLQIRYQKTHFAPLWHFCYICFCFDRCLIGPLNFLFLLCEVEVQGPCVRSGLPLLVGRKASLSPSFIVESDINHTKLKHTDPSELLKRKENNGSGNNKTPTWCWKSETDECDIYFIDLWWGRGGEMGIYVQTCMFNFQSQVLMDQINFF